MTTTTTTATKTSEGGEPAKRREPPARVHRDVNWLLVIALLHLNGTCFIGMYLMTTCHLTTIAYTFLLIFCGCLGATAGAHRLWAHGSYTASKPLRVFLMLCHMLTGQGTIYDWVLYHRIHHKYRHTSLDPFDTRKGFFHAHFVSYASRTAPIDDEVRGEIDMSDVERDNIVMFQKRWFWWLFVGFTVLLTVNAPAEYWGEDLLNALLVAFGFRFAIIQNVSQLIYSAPLIWCTAPGEKFPPDSNIIFFIDKSFWIDYHYITPWDYLCGEFGRYGTDMTSQFIRVMAAVGHATGLKTVDADGMREALFESVEKDIPLAECVSKLEQVAVDRAYYLEPLKVMA